MGFSDRVAAGCRVAAVARRDGGIEASGVGGAAGLLLCDVVRELAERLRKVSKRRVNTYGIMDISVPVRLCAGLPASA